MITTKNPKDLVFLNCHDLPEAVCVETRFITQAVAMQTKNEQIFYLTNKNGNVELTKQPSLSNNSIITKPTTVALNIQAKPAASTVLATVPQIQSQSTGTIVPLATPLTIGSTNIISNRINSIVALPLVNTSQLPTFNMSAPVVPVATNTLNAATIKGTFNEQLQQTHITALNMNSIGIQCKLDEELDDLDIEWPPMVEEESVAKSEMEQFHKFIYENSTKHTNFKECLICGEVCKSDKYFYGHMNVHRGPKVLCCKCGKYLDNDQLLTKHICHKAQRLEKALLQCPYYNCNVVAISRLELYDHINEHSNDRMYKCSGCNRGFCTGQEFLRHLLIRAKCYTGAKRKRFRVYGLEFPKDRLCRVRVFTLHTFKKRTTLVKSFLSQRVSKSKIGFCKICLKSFTNKSVYNRHRVKCVAQFRKRLFRKRREPATS